MINSAFERRSGSAVWGYGGAFLLLAVCVLPLRAQSTPDSVFDLVIRNGRVMDPEHRLDSMLTVGIRGGSIAALSAGPLTGHQTIDAAGCVVAPGFIDILSYDPVEIGAWNKLTDGVTTALAMHGGTAEPNRWYAAWKKQRQIGRASCRERV
jgi:dihydroorotase